MLLEWVALLDCCKSDSSWTSYIMLSKSCPGCLIQCLHVFACCSELQCGTVQHSAQECTAFEVSFGNQASHSTSMNGAPSLLIAASWPLEAGTGILDQTSCVQNSCLVNLQKIIYLMKG
ncbi:hypothetical protein PIB30_003868 [Stylosanthes scabra]|uniref:Uncharacterized protein n=1 Tax=Stylosanthes scabra TaxID=79078 RepID=A0ABU6T436_9FABA|nr:hypothetical protein [Stylosanthes scabra]